MSFPMPLVSVLNLLPPRPEIISRSLRIMRTKQRKSLHQMITSRSVQSPSIVLFAHLDAPSLRSRRYHSQKRLLYPSMRL